MPVDKLGLPPLPSFVIIGAPGCATRWLRFNLDRHPEIYAPPRFGRAEPAFLYHDDRLNGEELIAYRRGFRGWAGEPIIGALEPRCMLKQTRTALKGKSITDPRGSSRRMARAMPDCRVVLMVRNPVDRLELDFHRAVERGDLPPDADLAAMVREFDLRLVDLDINAGGMYLEATAEYLERFGQALLVLFYDDVVDDPESSYRRVLQHVGASTDFVPPELDRARYGPHKSALRVRLSHEDRVTLFESVYRMQVAEVEKLTGRDLSAWNPTLEARV